jgi:two-component sensor histidine kinase
VSAVSFLLVDDLEDNLLSLEALLRRESLVLLKAQSGDQALELLLHNDVALALIDVQMPGLNGFELAELMRGNERTRRIPIIFVTAGSADNRRRFRGYEAGAVDFIQKPIEADILRSKADVFFELCRQRQQISAQRDELEAQAEALKEAGRRKDEFLITLTHDITRHEHARAQQEVLLREISHRIKNLFSVTAGLISLSAQTSTNVEELAVDLRSRLQALARAHDLTLPDLSHNGATEPATTVADLLQAILAPHEHTQGSRIAITGSNVSLSRNALTSLALLVHELTTNAAKYGALSSPCGQLTIDIETIGELLHVRWEEQGAPPLAEAFHREGFGTILEKAVLKGLGGSISREWRSNGLALSLKIPLERLAG